MGFLLLTGSSICIISVVRLRALHVGAVSKDPTYDNFGIAIWSVIEVNCAIVGACLPTLKPLIARIFPGLLSTGFKRSRNTPYLHHSAGVDRTPAHSNRQRTTGDAESATQILDDDELGVVLSDMDIKNTHSVQEDYKLSTTGSQSDTTRGGSEDNWSLEHSTADRVYQVNTQGLPVPAVGKAL